MVSAIVLAAGSSSRMGSPKSLLTICGKSFIRHIVDELTAAGVHDVVIVLGADAKRVREALTWFTGRISINERWSDGQLSSIVAGMRAAEDWNPEGLLLCPVDHPLISRSVIESLVETFRSSGKRIILPVFKGRRGHPVLFARKLFRELAAAPPEIGARALVRAHPDEIVEVQTSEEGVQLNVDTPEDYRTMILKQDKE